MAPRRNTPTRNLTYERLKQKIVSGRLPPDAPLIASRLAASEGVSRTPVREALLRLLAEGLVVEKAAGLFVNQLSEEEIIELYEVRVPLEALAARLAAAHVTPVHLVQIEAVHEKFAAAASQSHRDVEWLAAVNLELHRAICQAARNQLLSDFLSRIHEAVGRFRNTTFRRPGRLAEAVAEHQQLVAAIAARDPGLAEVIARNHMQRAMEVRLEMYREAQGRRLSTAMEDGSEAAPAVEDQTAAREPRMG